jgi:hypothetical protein
LTGALLIFVKVPNKRPQVGRHFVQAVKNVSGKRPGSAAKPSKDLLGARQCAAFYVRHKDLSKEEKEQLKERAEACRRYLMQKTNLVFVYVHF